MLNRKPITGIKQLLGYAERFSSMLPAGIDTCIDSASIHLERSDQGSSAKEANELAAFQSFVATRLEERFGKDERIGFVLGSSTEAGGIWVSHVDLQINEEAALAQGFTTNDVDLADAVLSQVCEQIASALNDEVVREAEPLFDLNRQCLKPGKGLPVNERMQSYLIDIGLLALCQEGKQGDWIMSKVVALRDYFETDLTGECIKLLAVARTEADLEDVIIGQRERLDQAYTRQSNIQKSSPNYSSGLQGYA